MKTIVVVAVLFIAFLFVRATVRNNHVADPSAQLRTSKGKGINFFEGSWQEALVLAKKEKKLIFLDAYASWCGPCKLMKWKVFSTTKAGEFFNANFINVEIDMEKGEGPALAEKYRVTAYPSLFFIDQTGKVKEYAVGYHTANQLIELGQQALK